MSSTARGTVLQQLDRLMSEGTLAGLGDGQLLDRFLTRRDEAAFEALVELHGPMVLGLCRRFLRDPRDIEDAFQATFLVLVRKASGIRDRGLLANWLYGVALRVATRARANVLRRRGREQALGEAEIAAEPESQDVLGIGPALDQELSRLPAKYRAPLVLCYLRGQTHDQAADELRCPVGTVRSRMARGRELLKRRLTRRGLAPTATLFGSGLDVPAHLLAEVVPARLVAATVEGALAIGSSHTIQAGAAAASVLALAQGVLTSMKFAQLKWLGLGLLATGLSAGGVAVVGAVSAQNSAATNELEVRAVAIADPSQQSTTGSVSTATSPTRTSRTTEDRLRGLENQIDRIYRLTAMLDDDGSPAFSSDKTTLDRLEVKLQLLLSRNERPRGRQPGDASQATTATTGRPAEARRNVGTARTSVSTASTGTARASSPPSAQSQAQVIAEGSSTKIRELEATLRMALQSFHRVEELRKQAVISQSEVEESRGKLDLTIATLQGMDDDFADEIEQAGLVVKRKKAELEEADAQVGATQSLVARNERINSRQAGMVSAEDVAKAESDLHASEAHARVKAVEVEEAELQRRKLGRWRARVQKILDSSGVKR